MTVSRSAQGIAALEQLARLLKRAEEVLRAKHNVQARVTLPEDRTNSPPDLYYAREKGEWKLFIVRPNGVKDCALIPVLDATIRERVLAAHAIAELAALLDTYSDKELTDVRKACAVLAETVEKL